MCKPYSPLIHIDLPPSPKVQHSKSRLRQQPTLLFCSQDSKNGGSIRAVCLRCTAQRNPCPLDDTNRLSPSTFSTPVPPLRPGDTNSNDSYSRQIRISWMSSALVRASSLVIAYIASGSHLVSLGCFAISTVFSHAQTVVICGACASVLCQPTGGKARLTEGMSLPIGG